MTRWHQGLVGALLLIAAIVPSPVHANTVELTLRDGRVSLVATNATPGQIFDAWSRAGGVAVINAERLPSTPVTIRLDDVPEEQALDTVLRSVSGYLARRRTTAIAGHSVFDRIVILATPATVTNTAPAPPARAGGTPAPPLFAQPPALPPAAGTDTAGAPQPEGIPQGPGVVRLLGPDGQPMEDDQVGAPPPPSAPYGDAEAPGLPPPNAPSSAMPPTSTRPGAPTAAPIGAPAPGMVVPGPSTPGQPR
jgi:hypothetical protein